MKNDGIIRKMTEELVKAWETGETDILDDLILTDASIEFTMFGRGICIAELKHWMSERARPVSYTRFDIVNYVCLMEQGKAQETYSLIGLFADKAKGNWEQFQFEGIFANTVLLTENGWCFGSIKFELTDANTSIWPKMFNDGITVIPSGGDDSFVANWLVKQHDDRIGWYPDKELPIIVPEVDAPWTVISNRENIGTEEEQIEEVFYRYAYGVDNGLFELYEDVFTDDAVIKYFDDQPWDKRTVTEMLKFEKQGGCRVIHTGFHKDIRIFGDRAVGYVYLRSITAPDYLPITEGMIRKRWIWARYRLEYVKRDGKWRIHRLFFYPGFLAI